MTRRQDDIDKFLTRCGWGSAQQLPLAGDASARRYIRLERDAAPHRAVLMDAPREKGEDVGPFLHIARYLTQEGFSPPEIFGEDAPAGLILLEDLGDDLFARVCARDPDLEIRLYEAAVDVLVDLHKRPLPRNVAPYDLKTCIREANLLTQWYLPAATGQACEPTKAQEFETLITEICNMAPPDNPCLVLRDYHAENLLWLADRTGPGRVGLLDFQDALIGHRAYDLVSLLEDARRDTSTALQAAMIERYISATGTEPGPFRRAFAVYGAQRNLKIIGIFSRLFLRDGKAMYLDLIPRVWNHLERDLSHPALENLKIWVRDHVPSPTASVLAAIKAGGS